MELIEIERRLLHLLDQFGAVLPPEQIEEMKALAGAGEPGVALENYCTQLFEFDATVPPEVLSELDELGRSMGVDEKYWARLRK